MKKLIYKEINLLLHRVWYCIKYKKSFKSTLNVVSSFVHKSLRSRTASSYPFKLQIEPTNFCNLKCPLCPTGTGRLNRPKCFMDIELYKKIIHETGNYLIELTLFNYGEPLMHKDIIEMIKLARQKDIRTVISTNGHFFSKEKFVVELINSGLSYLIVCLDGASSETLSQYRVGSDFNKIIEGITLLVQKKKDLNSIYPFIELQFIIMKHNIHETKKIETLSNKLGVDKLILKYVGIDPFEKDFEQIAEEYIPEESFKARYEKNPDGSYRLKGKIFNKCDWIYEEATVNCDGSLVPCCYDPYAKHILGNLNEESIKKIWNGKRYKEFRKNLLRDRKKIDICAVCPEGRTSILE